MVFIIPTLRIFYMGQTSTNILKNIKFLVMFFLWNLGTK